MDPITMLAIGSAVSSGAGAIGGLMNSRSSAAASRAQNDIAFRNYYMQQRLARLQEQMATAGNTDARGNVTEYVPGVGWVSRPTAETQGIIRASDNEERLRLTTDAVRGRMQREGNFTRQLNEGAAADATLASQDVGQQSLPSLRSAMIERGVAGAMSGANDMRRRIGLVGIRSGTGQQRAIAQLGRQGMQDTRTAIAEARLNAPSEYVERRAARVGNNLNQYGALASRATAPDGVAFAPQQITAGLDASMRSRGNTVAQALGSAMSVDAPRVGSTEDRTPVALDSLGQYLAGLSRMGGQRPPPNNLSGTNNFNVYGGDPFRN
jgi:hypothetical protein